MRLGFSSDATIASGPFDWRLRATASDDRVRFLLHRTVMESSRWLRLRGGLAASRLLQRVTGGYSHSVVAEADDVRVSFDGFDRYWMRVFFRGDFYEPELYRMFRRMRSLETFDLIDGGANIGFWSAVLTSKTFGIRRAIAVEASPTTVEELRRTAELCDDRFRVEHCALTAQSGSVEFEQGLGHASRRIANGGLAATGLVSVRATTVDELVRAHDLRERDLIVKLDVEGAELDCMHGARNAFSRGAIFIYEDHGKEPTSKLTGDLLALGARCFFIRDDGELAPIDSAHAASAFKILRHRGYNFLCVHRDHAHTLTQRLFS